MRAGRIQVVPVGPVGHQGAGGYLDASAVLDDGSTPRRRTINAIVGAVGRRLQAHQNSSRSRTHPSGPRPGRPGGPRR